jgi:hypothetical protein
MGEAKRRAAKIRNAVIADGTPHVLLAMPAALAAVPSV